MEPRFAPGTHVFAFVDGQGEGLPPALPGVVVEFEEDGGREGYYIITIDGEDEHISPGDVFVNNPADMGGKRKRRKTKKVRRRKNKLTYKRRK